MNDIRIETILDSDTLYLPQLKPLMGKSVEILVREKVSLDVSPAMEDVAAMQAAVLDLEDYDFDTWRNIRDSELKHGPLNGHGQ